MRCFPEQVTTVGSGPGPSLITTSRSEETGSFILSFPLIIGQGLLLVSFASRPCSLACTWAERSMTGACSGMLAPAEMVSAEGVQAGHISTTLGVLVS